MSDALLITEIVDLRAEVARLREQLHLPGTTCGWEPTAKKLAEKLRGLEQISLTDGELAAAMSESGWVLNGKGAEREFALLARAIERRVVGKIKNA